MTFRQWWLEGRDGSLKRRTKVDKATKPVTMIPLKKAWDEIGDDIWKLSKKTAAVYHVGMFIMGVLYVSGTKTIPHIMFISHCVCNDFDQNWIAFWPELGQSNLNKLNFDECIIEDIN